MDNVVHAHEPTSVNSRSSHDDVIKWKHFPRYWPFVRGINRSSVNSPLKGQWRRALVFSLICTRINGWVNNGETGDLRRYRAHYDVTVMDNKKSSNCPAVIQPCFSLKNLASIHICNKSPTWRWDRKFRMWSLGISFWEENIVVNLLEWSIVIPNAKDTSTTMLNSLSVINLSACRAMFTSYINIRGQRPISVRTYFRHICSLGVNFMQLWFFVSNRFLI